MISEIIKKQYVFNYLKVLSFSLGVVVLTGCAVHKSSFDCSNGKGMGCGSMTDVHKAIKDKSFAREVDARKELMEGDACYSCQKTNPAISTTTQNMTNVAVVDSSSSINNTSKNLVSRSQDQIMRIWFNSYFDENNNFHDSQYIYTIIKPAQWLVSKREAL